jgi:uncharacterized protein (UPF0332 family)
MTLTIETHLRGAAESVEAAELLFSKGFAGIAASRAYYAMFYVAEAFLLEKGQEFSKHTGVIGAFGRDLAKQGVVPQRFHRYLIDGQTARLLADYRGEPLTADEALLQIDRAREMLDFARQHFAGQPPANA